MPDSVEKTSSFSPKRHKEDQAYRRLCFARFCWRHRHDHAPSGRTWAEVFKRLEGMTLEEYKLYREQLPPEKQ